MPRQNFHFAKTVIGTVLSLTLIAIFSTLSQRARPPAAAPSPKVEFCNRMPRVKIRGRELALAVSYKLQWKKPITTLNVFFFGIHYPSVIDHVLNVANEWAGHCRIKFQETPRMSDSQIRVTFEEGGYASVVGIEAVQPEYERAVTMCLQGVDTLSDESLFRRVVLHEFGHALGLEHELQNPAAVIPWDTAALFKYYYDHYRWQPDSVVHQVLTKLENVWYTGFDSTSIMIYAVPDTLTKGDYQIRWPNGLSSTDKAQIGIWYPKK